MEMSVFDRERASNQRVKEATQRILEISAELHLTVHELDETFERLKHRAIIGIAPDENRW